MKAGDSLKFKRVCLDDATDIRRRLDTSIGQISKGCSDDLAFEKVSPPDYDSLSASSMEGIFSKALVH